LQLVINWHHDLGKFGDGVLFVLRGQQIMFNLWGKGVSFTTTSSTHHLYPALEYNLDIIIFLQAHVMRQSI